MEGAMTAVSAPPPVPAAGLPPGGPLTHVPIPQSSLLVEPSGNLANDAMAAIFLLMTKQGENDLRAGKSEVTGKEQLRQKKLADENAAIEREKQAGSEDHGFFSCMEDIVVDFTKAWVDPAAIGDLGKDCEQAWNSPQFWRDLASGAGSVMKAVSTVVSVAVASVVAGPLGAAYVIEHPDSVFAKACGIAGEAALAAATGGAAGAIVVGVAIALSVAGKVVLETHCLGQYSTAVGAGLEVGAAVTALAFGGAGGAASDANAAEEATKEAVQTVAVGSKVVQGAATMVEGVASARVAKFDGDAQGARADATAARNMMKTILRDAQFLVDDIKDSQKSHERAKQSLQGAMQTNNQTQLIPASMTAMRG